MKKSNKILIGSLAVAMIGIFAVSSVMAYQGDYSKQGPAYLQERYTEMTEAMDSNNYKAWSELMEGRGRITKVINKDNFADFVKAHRLGQAGDTAGADEIRQKLGIKTSNGKKVGAGYGKGQGKNKEEKQGRGRMNNENRGQNQGGKFINANSDRL